MTRPNYIQTKKIFAITLFSIISLLITGCNHESKSSFEIIQSNPVNGQSKVSVVNDLTFKLSSPVDIDTVNKNTVYLIAATGDWPSGKLLVDSTSNTITFHPHNFLVWDLEYTLVVDGVKSASGDLLEKTHIKFKTFVNGVKRRIQYDASNEVSSYETFSYNTDGKLARYIAYTGAGTDGVWFTDDDYNTSYEQTIYLPDTNTVVHKKCYENASGRGADGIRFTDDDVPYMYEKTVSNNSNQVSTQTTYSNAGADGIWMTGDDVIAYYEVRTYNEYGEMLAYTKYQDPGPDLIWNTADDPAYAIWVDTYEGGRRTRTVHSNNPGANGIPWDSDDPGVGSQGWIYQNGLRTHDITYIGTGVDGLWGTDDDEIHLYLRRIHDEAGRVTQDNAYNGAGPDGIWLTGDDTQFSRSDWIYNADGTFVEIIGYSNSGTDSIWGTADDTVYNHQTFDFNANNYLLSYQIFKAGLDGVYLTGDDVLGQYDIYSVNDHGQNTSSFSGFDPGLDGLPATADDGPTSGYQIAEYDSKGNRIFEQGYKGQGADLLWLTGDDIKNRRIEYFTDN